MNSIAQTRTRSQNSGRLLLEVEFESGSVHCFEVDAEPFYISLRELLKSSTTLRLAAMEPGATEPLSTFAPTEVASPS